MDGIVVVDKPQGMTSHDVVLFVRNRFGEKKVGHTGILDPMATGVLILVLGRETKQANVFINHDKEYQAVLCLGRETSTQDRDGKIIKESEVVGLQKDRVLEVLYTFKGEMNQIPPMVSSRRYQGKRLYEWARHGIEVDRQPKKVWIHDLQVEWIHIPFVSFRMACSKGTYVRTVCHDVGQILGCGGHLYALQRIRSGPFVLADAIPWPELSMMNREDLKKKLVSSYAYREELSRVG